MLIGAITVNRIKNQRKLKIFGQIKISYHISYLEIVELIKDRKIEEAIELMQSRIPNIFDDNYILAFMKAHVFLQKVR